MMIVATINGKQFEFDGVISIPKENAVQLYSEKWDDAVRFKVPMRALSDLGKAIIGVKNEENT